MAISIASEKALVPLPPTWGQELCSFLIALDSMLSPQAGQGFF